MIMTKTMIINNLKKEKDAAILAHYYVAPEVQEIADFVGDSYQLSKIAQSLPNKTLVFCGVSFMGESATLLSPDKVVLMPDSKADCPMAHMVKKEDVDRARREYDDLAVVCYINSTAEIKSWSDVTVTSSNVKGIVENLPNHNILFIPDKNLGAYVQKLVPSKNIILVDGYCPIHENMIKEEYIELKNQYPNALMLAHPECNESLLDISDFIGSTSSIIDYARKNDSHEFIIATEEGIAHYLNKYNPDKSFYFPKTRPICPDMKLITIDKVIDTLKNYNNQAFVNEEFIEPAKKTLIKMMKLSQ